MSEEKKVVCKPGFNSCEIVGEEKRLKQSLQQRQKRYASPALTVVKFLKSLSM